MGRHETHSRRAAHRKLGGRLRRFFNERRPDRQDRVQRDRSRDETFDRARSNNPNKKAFFEDVVLERLESAPAEGYRAWHGGGSLSRHLRGAELDMAYEYLNWWLSGYAGAVMARQGYYISNPARAKEYLAPEEWAYWYDGAAAARDLHGPSGDLAVTKGSRRAGGPYVDRVRRIVIWNTVMDEYNYAARVWDRFVRRVAEGAVA